MHLPGPHKLKRFTATATRGQTRQRPNAIA
jgi:hypothetical protein